MDCPSHPASPAATTCGVCQKAACTRCLVYEIDGSPACEACGTRADERSRVLGSALLVFVAVAHLATLAVAYLVFRARPFVGGFAAVVALVAGRALQSFLRLPSVARVDAPGEAR